MKTIKKFMCFKLETGACIVAVFCMINALFTLLRSVDSLSTLEADVYEAIRISNEKLKAMNDEDKQILYDATDNFIGFLKCAYILDFLAETIIFVINGIFIYGMKSHNVKLMIPGVVICALGIIMHPINELLFYGSAYRFLKAIIIGIVFYVCFLTLYSAYVKVRGEKSTARTDQQESNCPATNP